MSASSQSLNHLLNFTLPPRQIPQAQPRRSRKTTHQAVWNKERFLNAQYRFVMNPTGDYTVHFADPDIYFNWQDILQVILPRSSAFASANPESLHDDQISCPICLSPPTAPRMTKCGHVFCFPCILHYLSTSENKWARCPICFDSVNERQLKTVKWFNPPQFFDNDLDGRPTESSSSSSSAFQQEISPQAGSVLRLRLMQRPQITTLALPRSSTWPSDLVSPHQAPFHFLPDIFEYAKFMLATPEYLVSDLQSELAELAVERRVLAGMNDQLSLCFIDGAVHQVHHQIEKAQALENPSLRGRIDRSHRDLQDILSRHAFHEQRRREEQLNRLPREDVPGDLLATRSPVPAARSQSSTPLRGNPRQRRNINPPPPSTSTYFYYQAASGFPVFLHPLDIRILLSHFNSYGAFPDTIEVRVDAVSEGTVNDDLRKRCKYLAHLPEGADVVFIEADLQNVVGTEGLKNFEPALKSRMSRRKEKTKKEDRARARGEEREREKERFQSNTAWNVRSPPSNDFPPATGNVTVSDEAPQPVAEISGAWGTRSFASAIASDRSAATPRQPEVDEWDVDVAWHELEQRDGPGRRKRSNKFLVLGGGGGRRR